MSHSRRCIHPATESKQSLCRVHKIPQKSETNVMMIDKVSLLLLDVNLAFTDEDTACCLGSNNFHTFRQSEQLSEIMCCRTRTQGFDSG